MLGLTVHRGGVCRHILVYSDTSHRFWPMIPGSPFKYMSLELNFSRADDNQKLLWITWLTLHPDFGLETNSQSKTVNAHWQGINQKDLRYPTQAIRMLLCGQSVPININQILKLFLHQVHVALHFSRMAEIKGRPGGFQPQPISSSFIAHDTPYIIRCQLGRQQGDDLQMYNIMVSWNVAGTQEKFDDDRIDLNNDSWQACYTTTSAFFHNEKFSLNDTLRENNWQSPFRYICGY